jgi:hypothetical protein
VREGITLAESLRKSSSHPGGGDRLFQIVEGVLVCRISTLIFHSQGLLQAVLLGAHLFQVFRRDSVSPHISDDETV